MRILIATVTAGGGHLAAANALREAWLQTRSTDRVECWDLLDFFSPLHRRLYVRGYVRLVEKAPEVWGAVFRKTDDPRVAKRIGRIKALVPARSRSRFAEKLADFRPDVLLCTHYLPLETADKLQQQGTKPFVASIVTDFEAHALWMADSVDLYCVASDATRVRLLARGASAHNVVTTGIPIAPKFANRIETQEVRRKMGLRDDLPVVLVLGGGFGMGPVAGICSALDKASADFQMVVVTGRNTELRRELATADYTHPARILGFAGNMHELMAVSSAVITKPGGLTTSEALAMGKPIFIVDPIPGQEAANSDFLLEQGAALKVNRVEDLPFKIDDVVRTNRLVSLANSAKSLGKPDAAKKVCAEVLSRMPALSVS